MRAIRRTSGHAPQVSAPWRRFGKALHHAALRTPAPIEKGVRPNPSPVVAYATPKSSGYLSGLIVQLAQAGRDRREVIRDPAIPVFLAHDSSLLTAMLISGAAMFLIFRPEDPGWAPGYRIAPNCIHFRPENADPRWRKGQLEPLGLSRLSRPSTSGAATAGRRLRGDATTDVRAATPE